METQPASNLVRFPSEGRPQPPEGPTCIDLFSGAGGLAEGFRAGGFSVLAANDSDPAAGVTFRRNFPEANFFAGPISRLRGTHLLAASAVKVGSLDCLIGGPPCQAFSYNNHQRSESDVRAGLFRDYLRIVKALCPKALVMENVPGILTVGGGRVVEEIYESLEALGYECEARILYARDFGVPQLRRRVFFIATRLGWDEELFPDGTFGPCPKPKPRHDDYVHTWERQSGQHYGHLNAVKVGPAISDLPAIANGGGADRLRYAAPARTILQKMLRNGERFVPNHKTRTLGGLMMERLRFIPQGGSWRDIPFSVAAGRNAACSAKLPHDALRAAEPTWGLQHHPDEMRSPLGAIHPSVARPDHFRAGGSSPSVLPGPLRVLRFHKRPVPAGGKRGAASHGSGGGAGGAPSHRVSSTLSP